MAQDKPKLFRHNEMQSLARILEEQKRSLDVIRSFGRASEGLRRALEQMRFLTEMPEAVRRSLEGVRSYGPVSEEVTRAVEQMRSLTHSETLNLGLEQLRAVTQIPEELKRGLEEIRSFARIPEELRRGLEQIRSSVDIPEAVTRGLREMRDLTEMPEELRRGLQNMRALTQIPQDLQRSFETVARNLAGQTDLRAFLNAISRENPFAAISHSIATIEEDEIHELHIQTDGTVVLDGETVTSGEIEHAITDFVAQRHRDLRTWLATLRRPLRKVVSFLLTSILGAVIQILITPYLDQSVPLQIQQLHEELLLEGARTRREVKEAIKQLYRYGQDLSGWRVTIASILNVRAGRANKARIIGRLPIGSVVRFIRKHDKWALIEYKSAADGHMKEGWVYAKYLRRLEKF